MPLTSAKDFEVATTRQTEVSPGTGRYHRESTTEQWKADETAVIVCDVWDSHHCVQAVRRVGELAPRIDALVSNLRHEGATIIHAPSDCMKQYASHPSRDRALKTPRAPDVPDDIGVWCDRIPSEEAAAYPLDQSDGGEDDDLLEHAQWLATLAAAGRNPATPWLYQTPAIHIDEQRDYVSDSGPEVWSILRDRKIKNILICGVHTNMCVLGRPFGLRQLASHGKHVALVRDLTDTMYNPLRWPYVSHFSGTDRIIDHVERYVCPTVASDSFLGGRPLRFQADKRPHLAILIAEDEYETDHTLSRFAAEQLGTDYRVSMIYGDAKDRHRIRGLEFLKEADALLVSVRRRPLPESALAIIRNHVDSGKPVIGIRTASHAFSLRDGTPDAGLVQWPEWDATVFGGHYTNHYGVDSKPIINTNSSEAKHVASFLKTSNAGDSNATLFRSSGSLYRVAPLAPGTRVLLTGSIDGQPAEPVAWTYIRANGGKSFYTSLGHRDDFDQIEFQTLLLNGIHWATAIPPVDMPTVATQLERYRSGSGKQRK